VGSTKEGFAWGTKAKMEGSNTLQPTRDKLPGRDWSTNEGTKEVLCTAPRQRNRKVFMRSTTKAEGERGGKPPKMEGSNNKQQPARKEPQGQDRRTGVASMKKSEKLRTEH
jgi:hypothetical protein